MLLEALAGIGIYPVHGIMELGLAKFEDWPFRFLLTFIDIIQHFRGKLSCDNREVSLTEKNFMGVTLIRNLLPKKKKRKTFKNYKNCIYYFKSKKSIRCNNF